MRFFLVGLFALLATPVSATDIFYVNTKGTGGHYSISRFVDGVSNPVQPVVSPDQDSTRDLAWPWAVRRAGTTHLYVSYYDRNQKRWGGVRLYRAPEGTTNFSDVGPVLRPTGDETAITPSHTGYHDDRWHMFYSAVLGGRLAAEIRYATSQDGLSWSKHGVVLSSGASYDAAGVAVDYVCQDSAGNWRLYYTALPSVHAASAAIGIAAKPDGPYSKQKIMTADGLYTTLKYSASVGIGFVTVNDPGKVRIGGTYILSDGTTQASVQPVRVIGKEGSIVYLDDSLQREYSAGARLDSTARHKISPSYVREGPDGHWSGVWTGFITDLRLAMEYTFNVTDDGMWRQDYSKRGLPLEPTHVQQLYSTENPEPVRTDMSCTN